ncbi:hypothetical protein GF314_03445 [bacterium]|nr:hypothetical protein [bacterium]
MASKHGCLKSTLFGCLGIIALLVIVVGVSLVMALQGVEGEQVADRELTATETGGEAVQPTLVQRPGRVELDLNQGEFRIRPGQPGTGVAVKARFDQNSYELIDELEVLPDSTWVYRVEYHRTIGTLQAILRSIVGGGSESRVDVYLPPDVPITLALDVAQGGGEVELGGLWLIDAEIDYNQGGFELAVSEPLREPLGTLAIRGSMGGFEATGLGNASPSILRIDCSMGGGEVDLSGAWLQDAAVDISVNMGGMAVIVPADLVVEGTAVKGASPDLQPADPEVPVPTLRMTIDQSMGEVEVVRR